MSLPSFHQLRKAMPKIRGNSAREVVRAVPIVKVYWRPYPHHGNTSSCSRTLIVWKQSLEPRSTDLEALGMAHPRGGFSYVLAYNSADSESREPVLQHAMYYRLYHRSQFAGHKTYARQYARHVPLRVAPAGCAARLSVDHRGVFPGDLRVTESSRQPVG